MQFALTFNCYHITKFIDCNETNEKLSQVKKSERNFSFTNRLLGYKFTFIASWRNKQITCGYK
jgi:hypothetical protein